MKTTVVFALFAAGATLAGCASSPPGSASARTEVCKSTSEQEVAALFDRWNKSLQTGDARQVVANYAEKSVLLATVSNVPRLNAAQKQDYFEHFLENKPFGRIDSRTIEVGCNTAVDAGLYTFTFAKTGAVVKARYTYTYRWEGSQWLITSHHSSAMPEK
ncbi:MAG: SgcJ/EcaC family oxidoreductase [Burkholderiales bacterium]